MSSGVTPDSVAARLASSSALVFCIVFSGRRARTARTSRRWRLPRAGASDVHSPDHAITPTDMPSSNAWLATDAAIAMARSISAWPASVRCRGSM
jgi:hypothetical protein